MAMREWDGDQIVDDERSCFCSFFCVAAKKKCAFKMLQWAIGVCLKLMLLEKFKKIKLTDFCGLNEISKYLTYF
jgi:hypothetical protein